jgi:hypothetical protein
MSPRAALRKNVEVAAKNHINLIKPWKGQI